MTRTRRKSSKWATQTTSTYYLTEILEYLFEGLFHYFSQECDKSNSGSLEGSEIKHFYDLLTQREEIDVIYGKYAEIEGQMSARDLLNFLLNEQREQASMQDALKLIEKYEVDETGWVHSDAR